MAEKSGNFDAQAFYEALDATREARKKTWKQVALESGISASTLTRMAQGKRPDVDGLAALLAWSGLSGDDYVRSASRKRGAETVAVISTLLKGDRELSAASADALDKIIRAAYRQLRFDK